MQIQGNLPLNSWIRRCGFPAKINNWKLCTTEIYQKIIKKSKIISGHDWRLKWEAKKLKIVGRKSWKKLNWTKCCYPLACAVSVVRVEDKIRKTRGACYVMNENFENGDGVLG